MVGIIYDIIEGKSNFINTLETFNSLYDVIEGKGYFFNPAEVIDAAFYEIEAKSYFVNLLEENNVAFDVIEMKSYASTILSEEEQADGYWEDWFPPTTPVVTQRKRKRFFISAFSYERNKNR